MTQFISYTIIFFLLIFSSQVFAKKTLIKTDKDVGAAFLLIGTSSAQAINDLLKSVKNFGKKTNDLSSDQAEFLFAYANYRLDKLRDAEKIFLKISRDDFVVEDYVLYFLADIAYRQGDRRSSGAYLRKMQDLFPDSVLAAKAGLKQADILVDNGNADEARTALNSIIKSEQNDLYKFEANLLLIKSYLLQGDANEALLRLKSLVLLSDDTNKLGAIDKFAKDFDKGVYSSFIKWKESSNIQYQIAETLMDASHWSETILYLEPIVKKYNINTELGYKARKLCARAYYRTHDYKSAIDLLHQLISENKDPKDRLHLLRQLAESCARDSDYEQSIHMWREIAQEYSKSNSAVLSARYSISLLLMDEGKYDEAIKEFRRVLQIPSSGRQRTKTLWFLAWCYYKSGDFDSAIERFDFLLKQGSESKNMRDRLIYWKARSLEQMGKNNESRKLYSDIVEKDRLSYYGILADQRLNGGTSKDLDVVGRLKADKHWKPDISDKNIADNSHLAKALFFDKLNLHSESADEIVRAFLKVENQEDSKLLLWLASRNLTHDIAYRIVRREYASILKSHRCSNSFERFVWEQAYPRAYSPIVESLNKKDKLDTMLVYALMHAESTFRPKVVSPVGAIGLMQLMPTTAKKVSEGLGESTFDAKNLYVPSKNIEYGMAYLNKLSDMFDGNKVAMIASYNAGEEAVSRWIQHGDYSSDEEFIEEIPYSETNLYVKKVLRYYWLMKDLYRR